MASVHPLEVVGCVLLSVSLQGKSAVLHEFVMVPDLIIAAILGVNFLQQHGFNRTFQLI